MQTGDRGRTFDWTPRLFLGACALAVGVVAQASPDAAATDASTDASSGADATVMNTGSDAGSEATAPSAEAGEDSSCGSTMLAAGGPPAAQWAGPPNTDGSLDDGNNGPPFTMDNGDALAYLGICETLPTPFSYTSIAAPYADAAGCMKFADQGHPNAHNCLCQKCFSLVQQCDALPTCQAIIKCTWDTGCQGSTGCYLSPLGAPCVDQINNAGTGSVATGLSNAIETCSSSNMCPTK